MSLVALGALLVMLEGLEGILLAGWLAGWLAGPQIWISCPGEGKMSARGGTPDDDLPRGGKNVCLGAATATKQLAVRCNTTRTQDEDFRLQVHKVLQDDTAYTLARLN